MKKNSKNNKFKIAIVIIGIVLIIGTLAIFSQSLMSVETSTKESDVVTKVIKDPLKKAYNIDYVGSRIVRKLAHKVEYGCLGATLCLFILLFMMYKRRPQNLKFIHFPIAASLTIIICTIIGSIDEFIQRFNGRGSMLSDVCLNSLSSAIAAVGMAILFAIVMLIVNKIKNRKNNAQNNILAK